MAEAAKQPTSIRRPKRTRSPNYPAIDLKTAIARAQELFERENRHAAPYKAVAEHWGYEPKSSTALQTVGALNSFGLIEVKGSGDDRELKLSDRGFNIVVDQAGETDERKAAIRAAALAPAIHKILWNVYKNDLPSDSNLRIVLQRDHGFNPNAVDSLIKEYKSTLSFVKSECGGIVRQDSIADQEDDGDGDEQDPPAVGDFVQWTSRGQMQFTESQRVMRLSDDGLWAFFECSKTGVPISELTIEKPPEGKQFISAPLNPDFREMKTDVVSISVLEGNQSRVIELPRMSSKAFSMFKSQLDVFKPAIVKDGDDSNGDEE